jgi:hypothetical protein
VTSVTAQAGSPKTAASPAAQPAYRGSGLAWALLVGASRAMPTNSLYAVWAIVFSIVPTGLHPTVPLVAGVLITFAGAVLVVSGAPKVDGDLVANEAVFPPAAR